MAAIDIAIVIIFAAAAIMGYRKGFIAQAGALAAIVVAVIACRMLGPAATGLIMPDAAEAETGSSWQRYTASILAYCGIYIVAYYAVVLVARLLKLVTHTLMLGPLDRIGGAAVCVLKWFMAVSLVANLYLALWPDGKVLSASQLGGGRPVAWIVKLAPTVLGAITEHASGPDGDAAAETTSSSTSNAD